jgi:hypothetical protein
MACLTQKTAKTGVSYFPPFVSRLLLVLLDLIAPLVAKHLARTSLDLVSDEEIRDEIKSRLNLTSLISKELMTSVTARYDDVSPSLRGALSMLNKSGASFEIAQTNDDRILKVMSPASPVALTSLLPAKIVGYLGQSTVNGILLNVICTEGLRNAALTIQSFRSLTVNLKQSVGVYFQTWTSKQANGDTRDYAEQVLERFKVVATGFAALHQAPATGMHSSETQLSSYSSGRMFGGEGVQKRIPELIAESAATNSLMICVLHGFSSAREQSLNYAEVHPGSKLLMRDARPLASMLNLESNKDVVDAVSDELRSCTEGAITAPLSADQEKCWIQIATTNKDVLITQQCGGGKTLSAIAPYLLPCRRGLIVLVITPFRGLLENHLKKMGELNIPYEVYRKGDGITEAKFFPSAFTNGTRLGDASTTFVFALADRFDDTEFLTFIDAADTFGRLAAFVVDECHELVLATYREVMNSVKRTIRSSRARVIALSGTLPIELRETLIRDLGLATSRLDILESSNPSNMLGRRVVNCMDLGKGANVSQVIVQVVLNWKEEEHSRASSRPQVAMIYAYTKNEARRIAYALGTSVDDAAVIHVDSESTEEQRSNAIATMMSPTERFTFI